MLAGEANEGNLFQSNVDQPSLTLAQRERSGRQTDSDSGGEGCSPARRRRRRKLTCSRPEVLVRPWSGRGCLQLQVPASVIRWQNSRGGQGARALTGRRTRTMMLPHLLMGLGQGLGQRKKINLQRADEQHTPPSGFRVSRAGQPGDLS